jgi:hypothetical protein
MAEPISTLFSSLFSSSALPAATAPSILGGGMTGAGMMTAGAPIVPGLLTSTSPSMLGSLGAIGSAGLDYAKNNPALGLGIYDRLSQQQQPMQTPQLGVIRPQASGQYQPPMQARIPQSTYPRRLI